MASKYFIIRPHKIRFFDLLSLSIFRKPMTKFRFVECCDSTAAKLEGEEANWITTLTLLIQKVVLAISIPMKWAGIIIEFLLNFVALNGGILGLLWNIMTVSVVFPNRKAANYRSFIGFIDGRIDLQESNSLLDQSPVMDPEIRRAEVVDLTMMASKLAYENAAYIEDVVTSHWKMKFVGFRDYWNKFLNEAATQAFIFCNKAEDADLIIVAFRGTEPFNTKDWSTDVDLSWLCMGEMGNVHLGFLKALGLQDEKDREKGFPKEFTTSEDQPIAYYALREELKALLTQHTNAKIVVTGHSLGGALAAIFPALLAMHDEGGILDSLYGVFTFGQPRVGDGDFKKYVSSHLNERSMYYRMVYRYDIVPRIPFDMPPFALFKHCGTCMYYNGWYDGKILTEDEPNPNYFDPKYSLSVYWNAWGDLFKGMLLAWTQDRDHREGFVSLLYRATGLILPGIASHSPRDYVNSGLPRFPPRKAKSFPR